MKIKLELHRDGNFLLLDSQDLYKHIPESVESNIRMAYYVDRWCEYLNWPLLHNQEMAFGDPDYARLDGWLTGYSFAKRIEVVENNGFILLRGRGYQIELPRPFAI